ncbi:hypothetical protein HOY80DRAFT_1036363 [Tuber brumale]|nr:hypothetical protein HOY80DRAFT_1036363 [Tuber brumale]
MACDSPQQVILLGERANNLDLTMGVIPQEYEATISVCQGRIARVGPAFYPVTAFLNRKAKKADAKLKYITEGRRPKSLFGESVEEGSSR